VANFIVGGSIEPESIAVDSGHIYWGNLFNHSIGRANLDGTGVNQNFITTGSARDRGRGRLRSHLLGQ